MNRTAAQAAKTFAGKYDVLQLFKWSSNSLDQ
jgi:hypothetical protein